MLITLTLAPLTEDAGSDVRRKFTENERLDGCRITRLEVSEANIFDLARMQGEKQDTMKKKLKKIIAKLARLVDE